MRRYMSKSQRACDFCRSRRSACRIETAPPCQLCAAHGRSCTFEEPARPRKARRLDADRNSSSSTHPATIPAPTAVQPTEQDFASWMMDMNFDLDMVNQDWSASLGLDPPLETLIATEDATASPANGNDDENLPQGLQFLGGHETSPAMHSDAEKSQISRSSQDVNASTTTGQLCGLSGDMDPYLLDKYCFDPGSHSMVFKKLAVRSVTRGIHPVQFLVTIDQQTEDRALLLDEQRIELEGLVSPEIGSRLIDLYFRFIYPQLPVLSPTDKPDVLQSPPFLLAAVYVVAQAFSSFDDVLCIQTLYDEPPLSKLIAIARDATSAGGDTPTIAHLQAELLLLLAPPENPVMPNTSGRWSQLGSVVTMAQCLGLFHDPGHWNIAAEEIRLRRRLSWAVRLADSWLSAALGRAPLIATSNWLVLGLTPDDFGETAIDRIAARTYRKFVDLTMILIAVLEGLYALSVVDSLAADFRKTLRTAHPIMSDLGNWYNGLDLIEQNADDEHEAPNPAILLLGYHVVKMWVLRATARPFHRLEEQLAEATAESRAMHEAWCHLRLAMERSTVAFASFTAELDSGRIHAFWPFWSASAWSGAGQMCTVLLLMSSTTEETQRAKNMLDRLRRILRLQAKSLSILRLPLLRLDSIYWKGFESCFGPNVLV